MDCPYCSKSIHPNSPKSPIGHRSFSGLFYSDREGGQHRVEVGECPACEGVFLLHSDMTFREVENGGTVSEEANEYVLLPRVGVKPPPSPDVPEPYWSLYNEASLILKDSPRASAMLSRRCLQHVLREKAGAQPQDLHKEIEWALTNAGLPGHVTESLHDLRKIGNMGAHPNKSVTTGEYLEVQPDEAEWTLDTLDALFAYYFVEPAKTAARRQAFANRGAP